MDIFQKATHHMKQAIHELSDKDKNFILTFQPCENKGYAWESNKKYQQIKNILSDKTDRDGHSGASFSICLRGAIHEINKEQSQPVVVNAVEIQTKNEIIQTLSPII